MLSAFILMLPVPPIFYPVVDKPGVVDVIMVLGPADGDRLALAEDLVSQGYSSDVLISAGKGSNEFSQLTIDLCTDQQSFNVDCRRAEPFTTQGEVGLLEYLSNENGWKSAIVITSDTHVSRTRLYLDRCYSGEYKVMSVAHRAGLLSDVEQYFYQTAGFMKAGIVTTGCM